MSVHAVPFYGRMSYCLIRSIHMVLESKDLEARTDWLECVSGEPFGFAYVRSPQHVLVVNGFEYHFAGQHLLKTLGYAYRLSGAANDEQALTALREALREGPVVLGMLDMGYLTYSASHQHAHGADHAIVALGFEGDKLIVHDPDGYVAVPLPISDLLEGWKRDIYTGIPYGMWQIGERERVPSQDEIWQATIERAKQNFGRPSADMGYQTIFCGPEGMLTFAQDLSDNPELPIGGLPFFSWRVSAQRCFDSASFVSERLPQASQIRRQQAFLYGKLQAASVAGERSKIIELMKEQADLEARFIDQIAQA
jgi:hypothetical protein